MVVPLKLLQVQLAPCVRLGAVPKQVDVDVRHGTLHIYLPVEENVKCSLNDLINSIVSLHARLDAVSQLQKRLNEVERWP